MRANIETATQVALVLPGKVREVHEHVLAQLSGGRCFAATELRVPVHLSLILVVLQQVPNMNRTEDSHKPCFSCLSLKKLSFSASRTRFSLRTLPQLSASLPRSGLMKPKPFSSSYLKTEPGVGQKSSKRVPVCTCGGLERELSHDRQSPLDLLAAEFLNSKDSGCRA